MMNMNDAQPQARLVPDSKTAHEANSLKVRGLFWFAAALVALTGVALGVMAIVMRGFAPEERELESLAPTRFAGDTGEYPSPRIQADPAVELKEMKAEDLGRLNQYGWIDRKSGVAHIPVDRAIDILAKKGLPTPEERGVKPGEAVEKDGSGVRKEQSKTGGGGEPRQ
jgi:hypothetical protein